MQFSTIAILAVSAATSVVARPRAVAPQGKYISVDYYPTNNCTGVHGEAPPLRVAANETSACIPLADSFISMKVAGLNGTTLDTCGPFFTDSSCTTKSAGTGSGRCDVCWASVPDSYLLVNLK